MSFLHRVNRVTIFGSSYGGVEEWTTGFYLGASDGDADPPTDVACEVIRNEWQTYWNTSTNSIGYLWKFEGVKMATINQDGSTDKLSVKSSYLPVADEGPYTGTGNPPQIALVATLLSTPGPGIARKGRMYLPGVGVGINGNGKISAPYPGSHATTLATFFSNINASIDVPDRVILASKGPTPQPSFGINRPVESVKVGDVFDTQRRRRNQLSETYVQGLVTA
jgi:hypothetical protein